MSQITDVLNFWFGDDVRGEPLRNSKKWYTKDPAFDLEVSNQFKSLLSDTQQGKLDEWKQTPEGTTAFILLTDQFPRNIFRGQKTSFSFDPLAIEAAKNGIQNGRDKDINWVERIFFYTPFEHSETIKDQEQSIVLFEKLLHETPPKFNDYVAETFEYAVRHWEIIKRFGRFPHRNAILKRTSTPEEIEFLKQPHSSF